MRSLTSIVLALFVMFGAASGAAARGVPPPGPGEAFQLFDANIRYTSGVFVPLGAYAPATVGPFITDAWTHAARTVSRVAADGVTLILVRAQLPLSDDGQTVTLSLVSDLPGVDPGSLWAIDDQGVVDVSAQGGAIDGPPGPPRTTLTVHSFVFPGRGRYAFFLYRAPRNFDGGATGQLASRAAKLVTAGPGSQRITFTIVRPLVVFVHGTFADNDTWAGFPVWQDSANELNGFQPPSSGTLPFAAGRISFHWIWNSTGGVVENAQTVLPQLVRAVGDWRTATGAAGTQADVVTHSFGGFVARQVVQTQPDPAPLTLAGLQNFRATVNWGTARSTSSSPSPPRTGARHGRTPARS